MPLRALAVLLLVAAAGPPVHAEMLPLPVPAEPLPGGPAGPIQPRPIGFDHAPSCMPIYANETHDTGYYIPVGAGVELADDLHTTAEGRQALCAFDFAYYKSGSGPVSAIVTFYEGSPGDGAPGAVIAGPFLLVGLPAGLNAFHMEVPGGVVDEDVWMGVAFDRDGVGLLAFGPPTEGTTHDLAWLNPPGELGSFGGTPPADFFLGVYSSPSTAARVATWGELKSFYR